MDDGGPASDDWGTSFSDPDGTDDTADLQAPETPPVLNGNGSSSPAAGLASNAAPGWPPANGHSAGFGSLPPADIRHVDDASARRVAVAEAALQRRRAAAEEAEAASRRETLARARVHTEKLHQACGLLAQLSLDLWLAGS